MVYPDSAPLIMPMLKMSVQQWPLLVHGRQPSIAQVDVMARRFAFTSQAIRRNLNELCKWRYLQRIGDVLMFSSVVYLGYAVHQALCPQKKRYIGWVTTAILLGGLSILIDIGITIKQAASYLADRPGLLVITNNPPPSRFLEHCRRHEVMVKVVEPASD